MGYKSSSLACLALLLAFSSCINAFNITNILGSDPAYSQFNKYLTETKLAPEINKRNTITVLALDNAALSPLNGKPLSTIKAIISTHVLLDFYDEKALFFSNTNKTRMTTLFQASGIARGEQGFVVVALINEGEMAFASAVKNSPFNTLFVKSLLSQPFNISVLQVSAPIVAPGIDSSIVIAPAPKSPHKAHAPEASEEEEEEAEAPEEVVAESPEEEEAEAPAPEAEGPAADKSDAPSEAAAADATPAPPPSSSTRIQIGLVGAVMALASLFVSL
ncbi:hypothetical protein RIF29_12258 [Crotalaria pallida]|uniref:FAS1 domain-containing protein n=1 Tax=Crotalaria pallida TaxID=3830 RepID=A0AAN9P1Z3_CROPI